MVHIIFIRYIFSELIRCLVTTYNCELTYAMNILADINLMLTTNHESE